MIIIQARTNSTRLPNKVMEVIEGYPLIAHVIGVCQSAMVPFMVAIPKGDPLKDWLKKSKFDYFVDHDGEENDVLGRFYRCAKARNLDWVIRITADCPMLSPGNLLHILQMGMNINVDFVSNCISECIDGQEVEYITFKLLEHVNTQATGEDREHVTTWIKKNMNNLKAFNVATVKDLMPVELIPKMSVDTPEDLERVRAMFKKLKERRQLWSQQSVPQPSAPASGQPS